MGQSMLVASPSTIIVHLHIQHIVTVIGTMGARVKFRRAVPVSLC